MAALVHPAFALRRRGRRAHVSVALAVALPSVVSALGAWLYVEYRVRLRPLIFQETPHVGWMFERKEHLAFGALGLAWLAGIAYAASWRAEEPTRAALQRLAHRAFILAAALAFAVAWLGTWVAIYRGF